MKKLFILLIILFLDVFILLAQSELSQKRDLLTQKQNQLVDVEKKISLANAENNKAKEYFTSIDKNQKDKQFDYENKKNAFDRASKNVDLVSAEKINQLSNDYKLADKELREINGELQKAKLKEQETYQKLEQATSEKKQIEQDILNLNADIFDIQLREPVWVIGEAMCNLAENETPDQCRKRALQAAQRDAMEKGGKMVLESETIVKNYQLYLDEIRTHINAQIMEQDNNPKYGVKREIVGNNIRYVANLRLKVQSISSYNPYRIEQKKDEVNLRNSPIPKTEKQTEPKKEETEVERLRNKILSMNKGKPAAKKTQGEYTGCWESRESPGDFFLNEDINGIVGMSETRAAWIGHYLDGTGTAYRRKSGERWYLETLRDLENELK